MYIYYCTEKQSVRVQRKHDCTLEGILNKGVQIAEYSFLRNVVCEKRAVSSPIGQRLVDDEITGAPMWKMFRVP
jgi:hypothetical protein